jgi:hypothetical protein
LGKVLVERNWERKDFYCLVGEGILWLIGMERYDKFYIDND